MDVTTSPYNLAFAEEIYALYLQNPAAVDPGWRAYFDAFNTGNTNTTVNTNANGNGAATHKNGNGSSRPHQAFAAGVPVDGADVAEIQDRVGRLVGAYRSRGHRYARLDPLDLSNPSEPGPAQEQFGLTPADLDLMVGTETLPGPNQMTLRQAVEMLRETYCRSIGVEYTHIEDPEQRYWLRSRMEPMRNRLNLTREEQLRILAKLTEAETFEQFLHTKFVGAKRFSLEGGEALVPMVDLLLEHAAAHGVREVVIGMAHRGRLNMLVNILHKDAESLFAAFDDAHPEHYLGGGDVKYHLGFSTDYETRVGKKVHVSLCFNPSHLEWVNSVVEGRVRAKLERFKDVAYSSIVPLLIHGDAAFAGQGTVMETMQLCGLNGYRTGGTVHVVVNNQVGFTTNPEDSRSTPYCTDIGRMFHIPVFHVNGEDPEAVAQVVKLAMEWRQTWQRDVIIDLLCYRKHGHNEGDEPSYTQPQMYAAIARKKSVREAYVQQLTTLGKVTQAEADAIKEDKRRVLEESLKTARTPDFKGKPTSAMAGLWSRYQGGKDVDCPDGETAISDATARQLLTSLSQVPEGFALHPKLKNFMTARQEMAQGTRPLDWGAGEALAFASLVTQGNPVRLSGQDAGRGTFSHRHAVLHSTQDGARYVPLTSLAPGQAAFNVYDSPLSEAGVMGFDYGYSLDFPEALCIWEAQFGDFANGAQVIIDQFISSAEVKWNRLSGLTLLLPHGYEGQGPEHSSARLGRFVGLCANDNMQVCNVTTPAQLFHLLRRQVVRPYRKPLVVFTPKSLLRHKSVVSALKDFTSGTFRRVLTDPTPPKGKVRRVLVCSGKVFFDLDQARVERGVDDVAILRMEQLYPVPMRELMAALEPYAPGTPFIWVQEEPWNQGAWHYVRGRLPEAFHQRHPIKVVSRAESASPATGSQGAHKIEQARIVEEALGEGGMLR